MPVLTKKQFTTQLWNLRNVYRRDNHWVQFVVKPSWMFDYNMRLYIDAAYKLYDATANNHLKLTLLGGTNIRLAERLLANFGVTGVNGIQDDATDDIVVREQGLRNAGKGMPVHDHGTRAGRPVGQVRRVPMTGVGSILSEKRWTPLLNDALIIGGATANHAFEIALEEGEHELFRRCSDNNAVPFNRPVATPGNPLTPQQIQLRDRQDRFNNDSFTSAAIWREFVQKNIGMLWDMGRNNPRVLARELLGLSFLGYEPIFSGQKLGFQRVDGAPNPTFQDYTDQLSDVGFEAAQNRIPIIKAISRFLFNDEKAVYVPEDKLAVTGVGISPREEARAARYAKMEF